jgi:hypothetical protein
MPDENLSSGTVGGGLLSVTVVGVVLSAKERKVRRTPWPALNTINACFSVLIGIVPVFFWIAAAALDIPRPALLVLIEVGLGYCFAFLILRQLTRRISKPSVSEGSSVDWSIDETGVRRTSPIFDTYLRREGFAATSEDETRFLFFTSSRAVMPLPKRCLTPEQIGTLRALLAAWPQGASA